MLTFLPYSPIYFSDCLKVFEKNIPRYFHSDEIESFKDYLEKYAVGHYWVCHDGNRFIGCGGVRIAENVGRLVYGIIDPDHHKQGYGRELLKFRLSQLSNNLQVQIIKLDTTPEAKGFFERLGFVENETVKDGFAKGVDQVNMALKL